MNDSLCCGYPVNERDRYSWRAHLPKINNTKGYLIYPIHKHTSLSSCKAIGLNSFPLFLQKENYFQEHLKLKARFYLQAWDSSNSHLENIHLFQGVSSTPHLSMGNNNQRHVQKVAVAYVLHQMA